MAQFPRREDEIRALAQSIITGLIANPAIFPAPPIAPAALQAVLDSFITLCDEAVAAQAAADQAFTTKGAGMVELATKMKVLLAYAEMTVGDDNDKLGLIGWAGKAAPTPLQPPGQCLELVAIMQGEGVLGLQWRAPVDGGAVASYKIGRRERPAGPWMTVDIAMETEKTLDDQERGKEWEFRVSAINKAGEGPVSNIVLAVL